ncbi:PREDICTED: UPF0481 protein At3g47200-like [Prunus mume]|uniref:UPF0481 protein At3g47200-like n=1 Tax=Prunus mume TaxID=102107 RepID=A0ABM0PS43_PRUMU|nr:PREDICTED: UPF0481 protein At3g47200-like [Prunus mume]
MTRFGPDVRPLDSKRLGAATTIKKGPCQWARLFPWKGQHKASSSPKEISSTTDVPSASTNAGPEVENPNPRDQAAIPSKGLASRETPSSGPAKETLTTRGAPSPKESTNAAGPAAAAAVENPNPRDQVAILIEDKMRRTPPFSPDCAIYQVPERFRNGNEQHYKPRVVPIGPYHSYHGSFPQMQSYKLKYIEAFTSRNELGFIDQCLSFVRSCEIKARRYYVEPIDLSSDDFAELMLVDAIFVLELMLRHQYAQYIDDSDRIYHKPRMIIDVFLDVVLLIENQIPFFLLEGLYDLVDSSYKGNLSFFVDLTHEFLKGYVKIDEFGADHAPVPQVNHGVKHFIDFIRYYYLPMSPVEGENPNSHPRVEEIPPSMTVLDDAGVQFVTRTTTFLVDIQFNNGSLIIPNFRVDDWTETLFRNLIAFEQCHDHQMKYISQFMFLMGGMIKTSKDVDLLIEHGIISSTLGSNDDLSALFNRIGQGVAVNSQTYRYLILSQRLNAYCKAPWHRWKAILKRDYFNTPWKLASTIAAIILLVLTLIQTICSILSL